MYLGVALGNVGLNMDGAMDPAAHADLVYRLGDTADALGFHSVWAGDHVALPRHPTTAYPYGDGGTVGADASILDPFAVLAALAGRTTTVKLGFGVLVVPYRHPLVIAKLIASIDALSHGRVILGVGTGWMPEEFAAVGADFSGRGRDTDTALVYLRAVFSDGERDDMTVLPRPVQQPGPPVWVGGQADAAMRRAIEFGDVWDAPYVDPDPLREGVTRLHGFCVDAGRDPSTIGVSVRGIASDQVDGALIAQYAALGVTHMGVFLPVSDTDRAVRSLHALAERCPAHVGDVR